AGPSKIETPPMFAWMASVSISRKELSRALSRCMSGDNGTMPQPVVAEGPGDLGVFWPSLPNMVREGASVLRMAAMPLQRRLRKPATPSYRVPVLLIPGFMAGDWTMARLAHLLEQRGHP